MEQFDIQFGRRLDHVRLLKGLLVRRAVDQFVPLVAEPHRDGLYVVLVTDACGDDQVNVGVALTNRQVMPEVARPRHRGRNDVQPVERRHRPVPGSRLALHREPGTNSLRPEGDRLDRRGLAAVVRASENSRMVQVDALLLRAETLEVRNLDVVQQAHRKLPRGSRSPASKGTMGKANPNGCRRRQRNAVRQASKYRSAPPRMRGGHRYPNQSRWAGELRLNALIDQRSPPKSQGRNPSLGGATASVSTLSR